MGISDRINDWVEGRREAWGEPLGNFILGSIAKALVSFMDTLEPTAISDMRETLTAIKDYPETPPETKTLIDNLTGGKSAIHLAVLIPLYAISLIPLISSISQPLSRIIQYKQDRFFKSYRLDPGSIITAWRRDPDKYAALLDDLKELGWDDYRTEALKFFTQWFPSAGEAISWTRREAFEQDAADRYGLDLEFDRLDLSFFDKIGVDSDALKYNWRATWEHASFMQMIELLHRGLLASNLKLPEEPTTPEEWEKRDAEGTEIMYEWYRLVEITPVWRDLLTEMSWNVPTRVDVRRWWDMRTISEQELYSIYHRQGYHGKDLENYVLWTKVYTEFPTLLARWSNNWITEDDVRSRLIELGMPADRVEEMIQEKIKPEEAARVEEGKTFTKTEIYKGVKQALITREEGIELLMDLNYNRTEAEYLLDINVGVLTGSPGTYAEFKDLTTKYKRAIGKEAVPMPEQLKQQAEEVVKLTNDLNLLKDELAKFNSEVIPVEPVPAEVLKRRTELEAQVANAETQLTYAKTRYETELAKWRHSQQMTT